MSQHEFDDLIAKYLSGDASPVEEEIILKWYAQFIDQSEVDLTLEEKNQIRDRLLNNIYQHLAIDSPLSTSIKSHKRMLDLWPKMAAACILLIVIGFAVYWGVLKNKSSQYSQFAENAIPRDFIKIQNHETTSKLVTLSDGTQVTIEPEGILFYPPQFTGETRDVFLSGNGFFKVSHDTLHHFRVRTNGGLIAEALGTSFFIRQNTHNQHIEVAVVTGKVLVYKQDQKQGPKNTTFTAGSGDIILTPNIQVSFQPEGNRFATSVVEKPQPIEKDAAERARGENFIFEEANISTVLQALSQRYGIVFEIENQHINNCHFTGDISAQGLFEMLDLMCQSIQCSYEVRGTVVFIKGTGCQ